MENWIKNIGLVILAILDYMMQPTIKEVSYEEERKKKRRKIKILRVLKRKRKKSMQIKQNTK